MGRKPKRQKVEKDPSEKLGAIWTEVMHKQKGLMVAEIALVALSAVLLIYSMTLLRPQNTVVIVGYGDVYGEIAGISGGYRRESWANMLAYPIMAILFGFMHNLLTLRIYKKYGKDLAMAFVVATMVLIFVTYIVLIRITGEW